MGMFVFFALTENNFAKFIIPYFHHIHQNIVEKNSSSRRPTVLGKPNKRFPPVRDRKIHFLDITNAGATPDTAPNKDAMKFWNHLLQNAEMLIR